jgi:O-antigen/teichoic acid export membrane protein
MQFAMNDAPNMRRTVLTAVLINWIAVAMGTSVLLLLGDRILRIWGGATIARGGAAILPVILCSTALSALSVAGSYGMLAMGRVKVVTWLNVAAAVLMVAAMFWLLPLHGIRGMAIARLLYGPITLAVYVPLFLHLFRGSASRSKPDVPAALCEEA